MHFCMYAGEVPSLASTTYVCITWPAVTLPHKRCHPTTKSKDNAASMLQYGRLQKELKINFFLYFCKTLFCFCENILTKIYKNNKMFAKIQQIGDFSLSWSLHLLQVSRKKEIFLIICLSSLQFLVSHLRMALDSQGRTVDAGFWGQDI